jgi:hypothetical protein
MTMRRWFCHVPVECELGGRGACLESPPNVVIDLTAPTAAQGMRGNRRKALYRGTYYG